MTGSDFKRMRKGLGWSQQELATYLELSSYTSIQRFERVGDAKAQIPQKYWQQLAELFSLPIECFYSKNGWSENNQVVNTDGGLDRNFDYLRMVTMKLTALEAQYINLNRKYGNNQLLQRDIEKRQEIKMVIEGR